jgi:spore coat protein CotH
MNKSLRTLLYLIAAFSLTFCVGKKNTINDSNLKQSHGKLEEPNYSVVFPNNKVNRIDITIEKNDWDTMQADLTSAYGSPQGMPSRPEREKREGDPKEFENGSDSTRQHHGQNRPPRGASDGERPKENDSTAQRGEKRMGPPPGGMMVDSQKKPTSVPCSVYFNNEEWAKVGIRYKGNSSLRSSLHSGIKKLSFKLDFDQFEDEYPETKDQRFYGFKQLNLKNNFNDPAFVREKVTADLFTDFGLVNPKTSFYQVYVNFGEGSKYFGLYTLVEEVDDTVIKTAYKSGKGNLYKPEGLAASFAKGSFNASEMNKKSNKKANDYSDIEKLQTVLDSSLRLENYTLWKAKLSEVFDVPVFLKWLAANTVLQNWDTYGNMTHNYYLYNNPETGLLTWIPWDNNEALQNGKMQRGASLSFDNTDENWPLIRYVLDDKEWNKEYIQNVSEFTSKVFNANKLISVYTSYQELLSDYVTGENGEEPEYTFLRGDNDFTRGIEELKQHVKDREKEVHDFLSKSDS